MEFCLAAKQIGIATDTGPMTFTMECQLHKGHDGSHENKVSPTFIVHW